MTVAGASFDLDQLDADTVRIVAGCLRAATEGPFFPEWEFQTLFGVTRDEVREVRRSWPVETVESSVFKAAVIGSMNHLLGYPHGPWAAVNAYVDAPPEEVWSALDRLKVAERDQERRLIALLEQLMARALASGLSLGHGQTYFDVGEWPLALEEILWAPEVQERSVFVAQNRALIDELKAAFGEP